MLTGNNFGKKVISTITNYVWHASINCVPFINLEIEFLKTLIKLEILTLFEEHKDSKNIY